MRQPMSSSCTRRLNHPSHCFHSHSLHWRHSMRLILDDCEDGYEVAGIRVAPSLQTILDSNSYALENQILQVPVRDKAQFAEKLCEPCWKPSIHRSGGVEHEDVFARKDHTCCTQFCQDSTLSDANSAARSGGN